MATVVVTATAIGAPEARIVAHSGENLDTASIVRRPRDAPRTLSERSASSAFSAGSANNTPESHSELDADRMPPAISLWLVLYSSLLAGINLVIVIPTADDYAHRLGGDALLSGLMIGGLPLASMVGIGANQYLLRLGVSFKALLLLLSVGAITGNLLYALAGLMHFKWTLLAGRCLIGMCNGFNLPTLYISLTVGMRQRSRAILYFSAVNTLGYAMGPALASALEACLKSTRVHNLVLDSDTVPGWFMVAAYLLFMVKVILLLEDLPVQITASKPPAQLGSTSTEGERFPVGAFCAAFWFCFMSSATMTTTEVYSVNVAQHELGWSIAKSGLVLACLMFVSGLANMVMGKLTQRVMRSDRAGLLGASMLGSVACVFLFALRWDMAVGAQVTMLGVGLLLIITLAGLIRGFGLAISSKLAPAHLKTSMNLWATIFLCLGRGGGGILGAVLQPGAFPEVMLGLFALSFLISVALYSRLKVGARAN